MSMHINAKLGEIAKKILLPGDPLRAKYIAETYLKNSKLVNEVRGAYCYTGTYNDVEVSVMGTGMGIPSMAIYATELCRDYGCEELIRIGTGGGFVEGMKENDIVLSQATSTYSAINKSWFNGSYAPCADFELLHKAYHTANELNVKAYVGNTICNDLFYRDDKKEEMQKWMKHGIIAGEMEATALYSVAAEYKRKALTIIQISGGPFVSGELTAEQREKGLDNMIKVALDTLTK